MRWRDRLHEAMTSRIASRAFRSQARKNPILRPFCRASAATLFDLCAGFVYTQTLLACVRLDVLARIHERPRTPGELARLTGLSTSAAETLLRAAAALDLVRARDDATYGLGLQGAALIDNPGVCAMIEHNALLYRDMADPVEFLKRARPSGALARFWGYGLERREGQPGDAETEAYSRLMAASQEMIAEETLDAVSFAGFRAHLDVGGGHGAFASAVAARWPQVQVAVFDLPSVISGAKTAAQASGSTAITFHAGDFTRDALPEGADVISLVRVLHDHDDEVVMQILLRAARALPASGTLLIAEPMRGAGASARAGDAYFGFYLRGMGRGRARSADEISSLMQRAGFAEIQCPRTKVPLIASVLVGKLLVKASKQVDII